jgi:hypothetical protein
MVRRVLLRRLLRTALLSTSLAALGLTLARPSFAASDEESSDAEKSESSGDADSEKPKDAASKGEDQAAAKDEKSDAAPRDLGHMGQFGLRVGLVLGYRMVLRYSDSMFCAPPDFQKPLDKQQKFCGHTAPLAADVGLSFAVLDFLEPFLWARLGLGPEQETATDPLVVLGAGVRIYTMSDSAIKIFIEPAVGWELEGGRRIASWQNQDFDYKHDFVFHVAAGPHFDFSPYFGAYATGGISAAFIRALGSSLDLNIGVQGRYP